MRRRAIRFLALLWLGWYLSGPLFQTVDFWDSPQEELKDIVHSAGGSATLLAAVFCVSVALIRKLRERCLSLANAVRQSFLHLLSEAPIFVGSVKPAPTSSPPLALRI